MEPNLVIVQLTHSPYSLCMQHTLTHRLIVRSSQFFSGVGMCTGKIIGSRMVNSTLYPGKMRKAYNVHYQSDQTTQEFEEEELRPFLVVAHLHERKDIVDSISPGFIYLESRLTGNCDTSQYSCAHMYKVRIFPSHMHASVVLPSFCRLLSRCFCFFLFFYFVAGLRVGEAVRPLHRPGHGRRSD